MSTFSRRDFLKFAGLAFAASVVLPTQRTFGQDVPLISDPQMRFGRSLIRGTPWGAILSSSDEGVTWKELARLGENHPVLQFVEKSGQIYANLGLRHQDFWLRSNDAQRWFSA